MKSLPPDQSSVQRYGEVYLRIEELLAKEGNLSFEECEEIRDYFNEELFQAELQASCQALCVDERSMLYDNEERRVRPRAQEFLGQLWFSQFLLLR